MNGQRESGSGALIRKIPVEVWGCNLRTFIAIDFPYLGQEYDR